MTDFIRPPASKMLGICLVAFLCWMAPVHLLQAAPGGQGTISNTFQEGFKAFQARRNQEAIRLFQKSIEQNPSHSESYYFLGITFQRLNSHKKALQAFRKALELKPSLDEAHLPLGIALYRLNQFIVAELEFLRVLEINPQDKSAHFFLGLIFSNQKKYALSVSHLKQAAKDESLASTARFNLGVAYYHLKKTEEAKREFQEVQRLDPEGSLSGSAQKYHELMESKSQTKRPWKLGVQAGIEFSDNITRAEQDEVTGIGDAAAIFSLEAEQKLFEKSKFSATAGYDFFQSLYDDVTEQNFQSHTANLSLEKAFKGWEAGLDYSYNYNFLDKKDFLQIQSVAPKISFFPEPWLFLQLTYTLQEKTFFTDTDRDAISNLFAFNQFFFFAQSKGYLLLGAQYERESTKADEFNFNGVTGNATLRVPLDWAISAMTPSGEAPSLFQKTNLQIGFSYRLKDFTKETPSIEKEREDKTKTIRVSLESELFLGLWGYIKYRHTNNDSNLESVDNSENSLSLSLGYKF